MWLFRLIQRNTSVLSKLFKIFGYFLLFFGLCYQIQRLYKKLKVEPEIFSRESSIQSSDIPFPAVTICPPFTVKKKAWDPEFLRLNNWTINDLRGAILQTCAQDHDIYSVYQFVDVDWKDILMKSSPDIGEFLNYCGINEYWMNLQDCEKLFIKSITEYGICYTFNMLGYHSVFNKGTDPDFDTFKRTKITKSWDPQHALSESRHNDHKDQQPPTWSLETGYLSDDDYIQPTRAHKMETLIVETQSVKDERLCQGREKSFKMILHLPNELPQFSYETIDIELEKEKTISISAEMVKYEESLRNFPPEKRGCYFDGEKRLKVFKSYTKANCEYECMTNLVYSTCGCVSFSMPRTKDMKVCNHDKYGFILYISNLFPMSYYKNHENKKNFPNYPCGCLPSCTEIKYKVIKEEKKDSENVKGHLLSSLKLVFVESQIKKTSNYVTYEMENFIFDIGGLIGLFLGSSILSILELLVGILKVIKNYTKKVIKWCRGTNEPETAESTHSLESQSTESLHTIIEIPIVEMPRARENVGLQRIFTISEGHISLHGPLSIPREELFVEDLED